MLRSGGLVARKHTPNDGTPFRPSPWQLALLALLGVLALVVLVRLITFLAPGRASPEPLPVATPATPSQGQDFRGGHH